MKKYLIIFTSVLLLFVSCGDELDDTVFVPDPADPNLPAYTEWGYNSFGAIYEREYFISSNGLVPCKMIYKEGRLHFSLIGYHGYYTGNYKEMKMALTFSFPASKTTTYRDLLVLNDTMIDLSDASIEVKIENGFEEETIITILKDSYLHFKRAQLLRVDDEESRVILSGIFNIKFLLDGKPATISSGRFDLGINKDFYSYEN
jgi:hypothetical protein